MTFIRFASIDPGGDAGLLVVDMPSDLDWERARFIYAGPLRIGTSKIEDDSINRNRLFQQARTALTKFGVTRIVLERPEDGLAKFSVGKGKNSFAGASKETAFLLGRHFGHLEAAAADLPWAVRIYSYPVTTRKARKNATDQAPRLGWMQRREPRPPKKELLIARLTTEIRELRRRPYDGVLREIPVEENVNVLMAWGVLIFHCDRERGRV